MLNSLNKTEKKTLETVKYVVQHIDVLMDSEIVELVNACHIELARRRNEMPDNIGGKPVE